MGRPSDRKRRVRLQRPGKRERARAKKRRRTIVYVGGAGTTELKAGRKKHMEAVRSHARGNPFSWDRFEAVR